MPTKDNSIVKLPRIHNWRDTNKTSSYITAVKNLPRTRTGVANRHWRKQVRDQQNATTDMNGEFASLSVPWGSYTLIRKGISPDDTIYRDRTEGEISSYLNAIDWTASITSAKADNRALIAFLKHARSIETVFSGTTFAGELRETIRMIKRPGEGLRNLANSYLTRVKNEKKKRPKDWKRNLSSLWLEQAFGWTPLISEIGSAFKAYRSLRDSKAQIPISGFGIEEKEVPSKSYGPTYANYHPTTLYLYHTRKSREKCFVKYQGMVTRDVSGSTVNQLSRFGFNPSEFIPSAYELLPWSFLVDYFTNLGDLITCSVASRASVAWVNRSIVTSRISVVTTFPNPDDNKLVFGSRYINVLGTTLSSEMTSRTVSRTSSISLSTPTFSFELPGRPAQWANMTALFAQASSEIHPQRRRARR